MFYHGRDRTTRYYLGKKIGQGGEGAVYEIVGKNDLVAKLYSDHRFKPSPESPYPRQEMKEKIETMLDQPIDPYVNGVLTVAWPQDILLDQQRQFVGYTMPRVKSKYHIFSASRERERVQLFPSYNWETAILIALNLATTVKRLHNAGVVIGDMNLNNIMLDEKGHITLIDTDSYNIFNKRTGKLFKCKVGVPEVLPPELQGRNLAKESSIFTKQTDRFSLSIILFTLLMNNVHPFGYKDYDKSQSSSSNAPLYKNIMEGRCPYVTGANSPTAPEAPDISMLPKEVRQLFDRAFRYTLATAVKSETIANRPTAEEWQLALHHLLYSKKTECKNVSPRRHLYPDSYPKACPWCELERHRFVSDVKNGQADPGSITPPTPPVTTIRKAWPLWVLCILAGVIGGAAIAPLMLNVAGNVELLDFLADLTINEASIMLAICGAIAGAIIAFLGQEPYQTSVTAWPWMCLGLLSPVGAVLVAAVILFIVMAVAIAISLFLGIVGVFLAFELLGG